VKRGVVLPARAPTTVVDQRHASFFLSFVLFFLAKADKADGEGQASVLGEVCGVDESLLVGLGACLLELFPAFNQKPGRHVWLGHSSTAVCR
jgi:hypothetical protein